MSLWLPAMVWAIMPPRLYLQTGAGREGRQGCVRGMGQPAMCLRCCGAKRLVSHQYTVAYPSRSGLEMPVMLRDLISSTVEAAMKGMVSGMERCVALVSTAGEVRRRGGALVRGSGPRLPGKRTHTHRRDPSQQHQMLLIFPLTRKAGESVVEDQHTPGLGNLLQHLQIERRGAFSGFRRQQESLRLCLPSQSASR